MEIAINSQIQRFKTNAAVPDCQEIECITIISGKEKEKEKKKWLTVGCL